MNIVHRLHSCALVFGIILNKTLEGLIFITSYSTSFDKVISYSDKKGYTYPFNLITLGLSRNTHVHLCIRLRALCHQKFKQDNRNKKLHNLFLRTYHV